MGRSHFTTVTTPKSTPKSQVTVPQPIQLSYWKALFDLNIVMSENLSDVIDEAKALHEMEKCLQGVYSSWEEWWTYDGISGPDYWGLLNPEWKLCNRGRRQSPIDIEPSILLYDPGMGKVEVDKQKVNGTLKNTGHSVRFRLDSTSPAVMVNGGPLSYKYRVHEILLHYGRTDDKGSEHTISGHAFPAELQILGYNNQLYDSMAEAMPKTQGVVGVAVMVQISNVSSPDIRLLTSQLDKIIHKELSWFPLGIFLLRRLMQGDEAHPKTILANNYRPPQPLYNRSVRTNVFNHDIGDNKCFDSRKLFYRGNVGFIHWIE
ncbi:Carbonic anhydrase-related protein 10 like protein [Argiope bruennichi]|uniref:Carbonic anhydrase-related protein 10 like protein n=1 Tax=Argiope bruennichi TaxID=94029 RepID=A0A8T0FQ59_ARGBR|nr:Carbonic anhydrase-related protein 10 like protein [Argiope bruennichi]